MKTRRVFSIVMAAGLTLAFVPLGCGGAQQEYEVVSRSREQASATVRGDGQMPDVTVQQLKTCVERGVARLPRSSSTRYKVEANDGGQVKKIELRDSTVQDAEVEGCIREAIAAMTVPDRALRGHSSRPISGGESITREQRGPLGSESDSENPIVLWLIVEAVGVDVSIEVLLGAIAVVATILVPPENPKDKCTDHYVACQNSKLAGKLGDKHGTSLCAWCLKVCNDNQGEWPARLKKTVGWATCEYWR